MGKVRVSSLFSVGARPPTRAAAEALPRIWVRWFRHRIRLLDVVTRRVDGTIGRSPTETDLAEPAGSGRTWPGGDSGVGRECVPPPGGHTGSDDETVESPLSGASAAPRRPDDGRGFDAVRRVETRRGRCQRGTRKDDRGRGPWPDTGLATTGPSSPEETISHLPR